MIFKAINISVIREVNNLIIFIVCINTSFFFQDTFQHYSQERRLSPDTRASAKQMMSLEERLGNLRALNATCERAAHAVVEEVHMTNDVMETAGIE